MSNSPEPTRRSSSPGMREVARIAGVGLKTVSRVVNKEPGVSPATVAKVLNAIQDTGYVRSAPVVRNYDEGAAMRTVSVIVDTLSGPFQSTVAETVEQHIYARGFLSLISSSGGEARRERALVDAHVRQGVDGVIIMPSMRGLGYLQRVAEGDVPIVCLDRQIPGGRADAVLADNFRGAYTAVAHLLSQGHKRIAMLGSDPSLETALDRYSGYQAALEGAGLVIDPDLVSLQTHTPSVTGAALRRFAQLEDPPTALFTANGKYTTDVLKHLTLDTRVALIGFDRIPFDETVRHGVSVVSQHPQTIAETAVDLLLRRIHGDTSPPKRVLIGTDLIPRSSTELPPSPLDLAHLCSPSSDL